MGFTQSDHDPCIYISGEDDKFIIAVYVDDMILAGSKTDAIERVKKKLSSKFDIKDLGELKYFLGMTVIQERNDLDGADENGKLQFYCNSDELGCTSC